MQYNFLCKALLGISGKLFYIRKLWPLFVWMKLECLLRSEITHTIHIVCDIFYNHTAFFTNRFGLTRVTCSVEAP